MPSFDETRRQVYKYLFDNPTQSFEPEQVASATGISVTQVKRACKQLVWLQVAKIQGVTSHRKRTYRVLIPIDGRSI